MLNELKRFEETAAAYRQAIDIAKSLVNVNANDRRAANELLAAMIGLGDVLTKSAPDAAAAILAQALQTAETLRAAEPTSMNANDSCRMAHAAMAELEIARNRDDAAAAHYRAAIELCERALSQNPELVTTRKILGEYRNRLQEISAAAATQPVMD
jgi:tetratricopeptide (TPR) repeat protein